MRGKKTLDGIRFNEPATIFAIRHTTSNSSSCCSNNTGTEQQQQRQQHSGCIHTCQVYNKAYSSKMPGISGPRGICLQNHTTPNKTKRWKKNGTPRKKMRTRWELNHHMLMALNLPVHPFRFLHGYMSDWSVSIRKNRKLACFDQKTKTEPLAGRRRGHGRRRYLQGREGRARWGTSSNQRTERWISSRSRAFTAQNLV